MKKSRFSEHKIMSILKQGESGVPVADLCREHGMSSASFYKWRSKYGGMDASMMARMKELGLWFVLFVSALHQGFWLESQEGLPDLPRADAEYADQTEKKARQGKAGRTDSTQNCERDLVDGFHG